jgi:hypothetical protein
MTVGEMMNKLRDWPDSAEVLIVNTAGTDSKWLEAYDVVYESIGAALILSDPPDQPRDGH